MLYWAVLGPSAGCTRPQCGLYWAVLCCTGLQQRASLPYSWVILSFGCHIVRILGPKTKVSGPKIMRSLLYSNHVLATTRKSCSTGVNKKPKKFETVWFLNFFCFANCFISMKIKKDIGTFCPHFALLFNYVTIRTIRLFRNSLPPQFLCKREKF